MKVPIDSITISKRARTDLGDLTELKASIARRGLLNSILVSKNDMELVGGMRRLTCCKELGIVEVDIKYYEDLTEADKKEIELEENLHKEFTWFEKASLRKEIHELKVIQYGKAVKGHESKGWSFEDTAESLGISIGTLSQDIALVEAAEYLPKIKDFVAKRQALKLLVKAKETILLSELARRAANEVESTSPYMLHFGDAVNFLHDKIPDNSVDMTIFDPPWGIDADTLLASRGLSGEKPDYKDDVDTAKKVTRDLVPELYRVMKDDTHMYLFFAYEHKEFIEDLVRSAGFQIRIPPLIWIKSGGGFTDFEVKFMPEYEHILFCSKGLRRISYPCSDTFPVPRPSSTERIHPQQKPVALLQQFIRLSTVANEVVLDPCTGSGSSIVASTLAGRRSIGVELVEVTYNAALEWIRGVRLEDATGEEIKE